MQSLFAYAAWRVLEQSAGMLACWPAGLLAYARIDRDCLAAWLLDLPKPS